MTLRHRSEKMTGQYLEKMTSQYSDDDESTPLERLPDHWKHDADIIKLVYGSTPSHCRQLKDAVVWQIKLDIADNIDKHPLESDVMVAALKAVPELAFDIASTIILKRKYVCSCHKRLRAVVKRCSCGKLDRRIKPACLRRMDEESICFGCFRDRTLSISKAHLAETRRLRRGRS